MKRATGILPLEYPHAQDGYGKSVSAVPLCRGDRRKLSIAGVEKRLQRLCDFCVSALKSENFCLAVASSSSHNLSLRDRKARMLSLEPAAPATTFPCGTGKQGCFHWSWQLQPQPVPAGLESKDAFTGAGSSSYNLSLRDRKARMLSLELAAPATTCPCGTGKQGCFHWSW